MKRVKQALKLNLVNKFAKLVGQQSRQTEREREGERGGKRDREGARERER